MNYFSTDRVWVEIYLNWEKIISFSINAYIQKALFNMYIPSLWWNKGDGIFPSTLATIR